MYLLKRFCGDRFERINAILDQYSDALQHFINLIASASYPFPEVVDALANPFHAFPSEGLPGSRYFPGTAPLDSVELAAENLVQKLFGLGNDYRVTIQPHSGTQANQIVFNAVLDAGDTVLSLSPSHGGHISHTVLLGRRNSATHYHATLSGTPDYEEVERLARGLRPKLIIAGSSALPKAIDYERLGLIARDVGALLHADISHSALFVMTGHHPPALPHADFAAFNTMKNLRGPCGGVLIFRSGLERQIGRALFPGTQGGPIEHVLFAKLVCFTKLLDMDLTDYAGRVIANARAFGEGLRGDGFKLIGDGTDSHIVLVDLRDHALTGIAAEKLCERGRILINRNIVYDDPQPPWIASGLRAGTSCITTLGYSTVEARQLARIVSCILGGHAPPAEALNGLLERQSLVTPMWR